MEFIDDKLSKSSSFFDEIKLVRSGIRMMEEFMEYFLRFGEDNQFYDRQFYKLPLEIQTSSTLFYIVRHPITTLRFMKVANSKYAKS